MNKSMKKGTIIKKQEKRNNNKGTRSFKGLRIKEHE